ncbi:hypothetical protein GCM10028810_69870 [Spirosoma litoris]
MEDDEARKRAEKNIKLDYSVLRLFVSQKSAEYRVKLSFIWQNGEIHRLNA